jgi:hypothetical protein
MKRATEEKIKAIKRRYLQLQDLIKMLKGKEDPDPVLLEDLEALSLKYQEQGFKAIPEQ